MKMEIFRLNYDEVPEEYFVIQIDKSYQYLHFENNSFFFKERFHGCFVTSNEIADEIINHIKDISESKPKIKKVKFNNAYKEHGVIEKQIFYN